MATGSLRRDTRSTNSPPHSAQCQSAPDESPRKRRRANALSRRPSRRRIRSKLLQSAVDSCPVCVLDALWSGVDVNLRDEDGHTALMVAVEVGNLDMIELLINQGSDAALRNNWGETALQLAVNRSGTNGKAIVERLIACDRSAVRIRPHSGCTPLFRAAGSYHADALSIVRDLVEANADLEVRGSDPDVLNGLWMTPFQLAATVGNFHVCQLLYRAGCSVGVVHEWLRDKSFPLVLRRNRNKQWVGVMVGWATQPRMLQELCRIGIRRAIIGSGTDIRRCNGNDLPLPFSLSKFVLSDDI